MTVINLNDYKEYKATNGTFETKYLELLRCLGTPNTGFGISMIFYCFIRYMQGVVNSMHILDICGRLEGFELTELKQQMVSCLKGIIEDIEEV